MKLETLVSVIIPTFNRSKTILNSLQSVINQSYSNLEIIVVDDGSTDNTQEVLLPFAEQIKYIRQENKGQAGARNTGLQHASGALIASLDSDDVWHTNFLSKCVEHLEENDLDFVFTNWNQQTNDGKWMDSFSRYFFLDEYIHSSEKDWINIEYKDLRKLYLKYCPSPSSSFVIKRQKIMQGWNTEMNVADDWCLLLDVILTNPCKVAFTNEILWNKGINEINVCDGRNVVELAKFLYIEDIKNLMSRFKAFINPSEYKVFEIVYVENLIKLGCHHILIEQKMQTGLGLWKEAIINSPSMTIKGLWNIFLRKTFKNNSPKL